MLFIGYTNSEREIYFQGLEDWITQSNSLGTPLTSEDIFDGHCLMTHMVTYYIAKNDPRSEFANDCSIEYRRYLVTNLLWEKLIKRWDATIPLHFAKLGKKLALLEFK